MRYLIFILAFASAWGQVEDYGRTANAAAIYDLTAAAITRAIKSGASDPATCTSGKDLFINTSSTPVIKLCTATNTWTALGSSSMVYPSAGVAVSTGSAWGSSLTVGTGANNLVQLNGSSQLPAVSAALLTNFPTLNQNTTGTAAGLTAQYIDWNASSGGNSIANKPTLTSGTVTVVSSGNLASGALVSGGGTQTLQTPAATATLDASGNISTPGSISTGAGGSTAGAIEFGQGTAPSAGTTSVKLYAPASVTSYIMNLPGAAATGYLYGTNSGGVVTQTFRTIQAGDVPTLNQNTTGSAATLTTPRAIYGNNFDGSAALTQVIASTYGGTGNGFTKFTGPTTSEKTFTLPDASAVLATAATGGTLTTSGAYGITLTASATTNSTLPAGTKTLMATDTAVTAAQMPALTGAVTTSAGAVATTLAAKYLTGIKSMTVFDPVTGDSGRVQMMFPYAVTITSVSCSVKAATSATINLDERAFATPDTSGTAVLTSNLACDTDGATSTTFSNAGIAANVPVALLISAVSGTPDTLRVYVTYTID